MFDSQNGGGNGIVTAYATFQGMQPQTEESIMYHRLRGAMRDRLADEEAARLAGETEKLAQRMADDKEALLRQMKEKPAKAKRTTEDETEKTTKGASSDGAATETEGSRRGFWRRMWCFG